MPGKKFGLAICLLFLLNICSAQVLPSDCLCTDQLQNIYRNNAYRLAYKRIFEQGSTYRDSVKIPVAVADSIFARMALVYNIPASPLRDSVLAVFGNSFTNHYYAFGEDSTHVHGGIPSLKSFEVTGQQSAPWVADWLAGNYTNTSNALVNQLMSTYNLTAQPLYSIPLNGTRSFKLKSGANYNTTALMNLFLPAAGVVSVNNAYPIGDGCMIDYSRVGNESFLFYRLRCGDCPAGCTQQAGWRFKIADGACAAELLSSISFPPSPPFGGGLPADCKPQIPPGGFGAPPAGYIPCSLAAQTIATLREPAQTGRLQNKEFRLFPNPAQTQVSLVFPATIKKEKQIRLMDAQGRLILQLTRNDRNRTITLPVAHLKPGLYYLVVSTHIGYNSLVFLKQ
jgi:hypothetical protein